MIFLKIIEQNLKTLFSDNIIFSPPFEFIISNDAVLLLTSGVMAPLDDILCHRWKKMETWVSIQTKHYIMLQNNLFLDYTLYSIM